MILAEMADSRTRAGHIQEHGMPYSTRKDVVKTKIQ